MADYSQSYSTISRGENGAASQRCQTNWILRDKLYSSCCIKLPVPLRRIAEKRWKRRNSSQANFVLPQSGLRS